MPNWNAFNVNIGDIGSALAGRAREEKAKQDAFSALIFKSVIDQKMKEMAMQRNLKMLQGMGFGLPTQRPEDSVMPGTEPTSGQQNYQTIVEPRMGEEGGISFGFKKELTPQAQLKQKEQETKIVRRATLTEEMNVKRAAYKKDLDNFLAIDDILHQARGEGAGRFGAGFGMSLKGVTQKSKLGQAVGAYDAVSKRLRVQLVRAAGDVGNINIVEQQAAEKLIPSKFDSKQTAEIKRSYLKEISKAIDNQDPSLVKVTLDKLGVDYTENIKKSYSNLWE